MTEDSIDFIFDAFEWAFQHYGGLEVLAKTPLMLPDSEFFPVAQGTPSAVARGLFDRARTLSGMTGWPIRLRREDAFSTTRVLAGMPHDQAYGAAGPGLRVVGDGETFEFVATWVEDDLESFVGFLASVGHQLGTALAICGEAEPPGGVDNVGFLADVCGVYLGFGVLMTNGAFEFEQFQNLQTQGYRFQRRGWLSQAEFAYALAVFVALTGRKPRRVATELKPAPRKVFKQSLKDIRRYRSARMARLGHLPSVSGRLSISERGGELSRPFPAVPAGRLARSVSRPRSE